MEWPALCVQISDITIKDYKLITLNAILHEFMAKPTEEYSGDLVKKVLNLFIEKSAVSK